MLSKSLSDGGVVRDEGARDGIRGESGPNGNNVGLMPCTVECRLRCAPLSSGDTIGESGGVSVTRGSTVSACVERRVRMVRPLPSISGESAKDGGGALMGAASARGDETDDGVEERVPNALLKP